MASKTAMSQRYAQKLPRRKLTPILSFSFFPLKFSKIVPQSLTKLNISSNLLYNSIVSFDGTGAQAEINKISFRPVRNPKKACDLVNPHLPR